MKTTLLLFAVTTVGLGIGITACEKPNETQKEPSPTTGPMTQPATTNTTTGANVPVVPGATAAKTADMAVNTSDVKRFDDERKLSGQDTKITVDGMKIRKAPAGDEITTVSDDAVVKEMAERNGYYLVQFTDTKDGDKVKVGWIFRDAFGAMPSEGAKAGNTAQNATGKPMAAGEPAGATAKMPTCAAPQMHVTTDKDFCAKTCTSDSDCKPDAVCDGQAVIHKGQKSDKGKYCVNATGTTSAGAGTAGTKATTTH